MFLHAKQPKARWRGQESRRNHSCRWILESSIAHTKWYTALAMQSHFRENWQCNPTFENLGFAIPLVSSVYTPQPSKNRVQKRQNSGKRWQISDFKGKIVRNCSKIACVCVCGVFWGLWRALKKGCFRSSNLSPPQKIIIIIIINNLSPQF